MLGIFPHHWFVGQPEWLLVLIAIACMAALLKGADWLVESAATLALRLGISKIVIGATIVSLGTTSPEAAVSVLAAWRGNAGLALGNGVGSIIADTGLIFGLGLLLTRLPADRFVLNRQGWVQFGVGVGLAMVCFALFFMHGDAAALPRWMGLILVGLLVGYMAISVSWSRRHPFGEPHVTTDGPIETPLSEVPEQPDRSVLVLLGVGAIGLVVVVLASDVLVQSASELAAARGVPEVIIASTLVAFGTSLPELMVGITAIRKGHPELLVGNVIGADILNVLFVIGAAAVAASLPLVEAEGVTGRYIFLWLHLPMLVLMLVLMRLFIFRAVGRGGFSRWMGVPLVGLYVFYVGIQAWVSL